MAYLIFKIFFDGDRMVLEISLSDLRNISCEELAMNLSIISKVLLERIIREFYDRYTVRNEVILTVKNLIEVLKIINDEEFYEEKNSY